MTRKPATALARKKLVVAALEDIKARDIQSIDVRKITGIFDWIVVATAESARQTKSLARHVRDKLKESGATIIGMEGEESGEWVLVDAGDIVAHIMQPAVRAYYDLEELWGEGKFDVPVNATVYASESGEPPVPTRRVAPPRKAAVRKKAPARKPPARAPRGPKRSK